MEQYLMWMEGKHGVGLGYSHIQTPMFSSSSWEEQAFAEDARGPLGGFVWPPRSYSCSFCKREFRSAQALGGHMNVHRRDRARLKQSQIITPKNDHDHHDHDLDHHVTKSSILSTKSMERSQVSSLDNNCSPSFLGHNDILDCVETNLCVGMADGGANNIGNERNIVNFKRRKAVVTEQLDFGLNPACCSKIESIEEMDLELRLGGSPTILKKTRVLTI